MNQDELTIYRDGTIEANFPLNAPDLRRMATRLLQLAEMHEPMSDSPTDLDPIRGISPDDERESPDTQELPHSVRAIVKEIHTAAQQSRRAAAASARTLLYIDLKTKEGLAIAGKDRLKSDLHHIKATIASTTTAGQKVLRIEQITAMALGLPFQAVQS